MSSSIPRSRRVAAAGFEWRCPAALPIIIMTEGGQKQANRGGLLLGNTSGRRPLSAAALRNAAEGRLECLGVVGMGKMPDSRPPRLGRRRRHAARLPEAPMHDGLKRRRPAGYDDLDTMGEMGCPRRCVHGFCSFAITRRLLFLGRLGQEHLDREK